DRDSVSDLVLVFVGVGLLGSDTTACCFSYVSRQIPQTHVKDYYYTSGKCSQPSVVFITRRNRQVCANPNTKWVQNYINALELGTTTP
uniref:C-C motif chemokine n=1 Tax=Sphenodon punctatus TaxID=8508 RepID=A0A8D0GKK1_SPHPU